MKTFSDMKLLPFYDITREQCFPVEHFLYCNPLQKQKTVDMQMEDFFFYPATQLMFGVMLRLNIHDMRTKLVFNDSDSPNVCFIYAYVS
jgi:hypothetical protein